MKNCHSSRVVAFEHEPDHEILKTMPFERPTIRAKCVQPQACLRFHVLEGAAIQADRTTILGLSAAP